MECNVHHQLYLHFQQIPAIMGKKDLVSPSYSLQWHLYQFCQRTVISKGYLQVRECLTPGKFAVLLIALFSVINLTLPTLMVKLQHVSPVSC